MFKVSAGNGGLRVPYWALVDATRGFQSNARNARAEAGKMSPRDRRAALEPEPTVAENKVMIARQRKAIEVEAEIKKAAADLRGSTDPVRPNDIGDR